jgi:ANTAR domain-containing protein
MTNKYTRTTETGGTHRRRPKGAAEGAAVRPGGADEAGRPGPSGWPETSAGRHAAPSQQASGAERPGRDDGSATPSGGNSEWPYGTEPVARRTATGWRVGDEEVSDLTSAMVLADLLAADLDTQAFPIIPGPVPGAAAAAQGAAQASGGRPAHSDEQPDPKRLKETVAQLEHALTARVRVEQAIGVLAERHRLRPRQAFELLRSVARARGKRVLEIATEVVESATNPLLRIPEELAKPPVTRRRARAPRHTLESG